MENGATLLRAQERGRRGEKGSEGPGQITASLDGDTGLVQLVEELTERVPGAVCGDLQGQLVLVGSSRREEFGRRAEQVGTGEVEPDVAAGDAALQLGRGSFGDDPPPVEHRDPVRQLVRLVEVLCGEQDGDSG